MKRALIVGIDDYPVAPLTGCINDAAAIAKILETNEDGSPNFDVRLMTSDVEMLSTEILTEAIADLFRGDPEIALMFFAGHGIIDELSGEGYIVSQDGRKPTWGVALSYILRLAQEAYPRIKATVIILDSCQSGFIGEVPILGNSGISIIGNGVTILTASERDGVAAADGGHGVFTSLLLAGLGGHAADILGNVTPAALYALIDQTLGSWEQRPIYKANVHTFVKLRQLKPKIPLEVLRKLPTYFPEPTDAFALDPQFEPDRNNIPERFRQLPIDTVKTAQFRELQKYNRQGLVVPLGAESMYDAAMESKACGLTEIGVRWRKLAELRRF